MSSVLYLEQFLESLEPLPAELKKNFNESAHSVIITTHITCYHI